MEKIRQYLERFLQKSCLQEQLINNRDYFTLWSEVVGKNIAHHTMPVSIKEKKLSVEVTDSTWLFHLTMLKSKIIEDFNTTAGSDIINDLKFFNVDFRSRDSRQKNKKGINKKEALIYERDENITIEPDEEEELKKAVSLSPEYFQIQLYNFLKKSCLYQKKRKKMPKFSTTERKKGER